MNNEGNIDGALSDLADGLDKLRDRGLMRLPKVRENPKNRNRGVLQLALFVALTVLVIWFAPELKALALKIVHH